MKKLDSPRQSAATAAAFAALYWLILAVLTVGSETDRGAAFLLRQPSPASLESSQADTLASLDTR